MLWIRLGRWSHQATRYFLLDRIYLCGYRWTPFVRVRIRSYSNMNVFDQNLGGKR